MENNIIVTESSENIRRMARQSLTGRWGFAAVGTLIYLAVIMVPVLILDLLFGAEDGSGSIVSTVYSMIIAGPTTLGYTMFVLSIFRRRETSVAEVFYGFEKFGKALGLYLVMSVFIFLWTLLLIIPGIIASFRYALAFYVLADNPEMGIMEAINESKRLMRGNKWKLFCLQISFIGWALLGLLTLGIGYLWLTPYMEVSIAAFYEMTRGNMGNRDNIRLSPESLEERGL